MNCLFLSSLTPPLTGGKDSLVVWHMTYRLGKSADPFYVTDEIEVYTENWRLKEFSAQMGKEFLVGLIKFCYNLMTISSS